MKIRISVEGEGASLALKSSQRGTAFVLNSGEHSVELGEGEVLILHDARRDPNHPIASEETSRVVIGQDDSIVPDPMMKPE